MGHGEGGFQIPDDGLPQNHTEWPHGPSLTDAPMSSIQFEESWLQRQPTLLFSL